MPAFLSLWDLTTSELGQKWIVMQRGRQCHLAYHRRLANFRGESGTKTLMVSGYESWPIIPAGEFLHPNSGWREIRR
jgi:hypothetical protein